MVHLSISWLASDWACWRPRTYPCPKRQTEQDGHERSGSISLSPFSVPILLGNTARRVRPDDEKHNNSCIQSRDQDPKWQLGGCRNAKRVGLGPSESDEDGSGKEPDEDDELRDQLRHGKFRPIINVDSP